MSTSPRMFAQTNPATKVTSDTEASSKTPVASAIGTDTGGSVNPDAPLRAGSPEAAYALAERGAPRDLPQWAGKELKAADADKEMWDTERETREGYNESVKHLAGHSQAPSSMPPVSADTHWTVAYPTSDPVTGQQHVVAFPKSTFPDPNDNSFHAAAATAWEQLKAGVGAVSESFGLPSNMQEVRGANKMLVGQLSRPIDTLKQVAKQILTPPSDTALLDKAKASWNAGNHVDAARHLMNFMLPFIGSASDRAGDELQTGEYGKAVGHTVSAVLPFLMGTPEAAPITTSEEAATATARQFKPEVAPKAVSKVAPAAEAVAPANAPQAEAVKAEPVLKEPVAPAASKALSQPKPAATVAVAEAPKNEAPTVPTFFSKAERVANEKVNTGSGDSILSTLKNNGVKANEIDWLGLDDYLKGKPKVSKADVQQFINEHKISLGEVDLGKNADQLRAVQKERDAAYAENNRLGMGALKYESGFRDLINAMNEQRDLTPIISKMPDELQAKARRFVETDQMIHTADDQIKSLGSKNWMPTQFEQYTLPGEKSGYQEKLLTLPDKTRPQIDALNARLEEIANRPSAEHAAHPEWRDEVDSIRKQKNTLLAQPEFRGSHFETPNIVAHVRYDERPALDGKKTLFLEELQSDWANKGKQEGYNDPNRRTALENQISDLGKRRQEIEDKGADATEQEKQEWADIKNTLVGLQRTFNATHKGVPDMPFKSSWHELALKRMLRHAAENGYDQLAWTTGDQQAERYDLSKQVDEIRATRAKDTGKISVTAFKDGSPVLKQTDVEDTKLADVVGKELANKIIGQPTGKQHSYSGVDLKVGGESLKNLYDKVVPNFLNKYASKWGAKVGTTTLRGGKIGSLKMNGVIRDALSGRYQVELSDGDLWGSFSSDAEAKKAYNAEFMPEGQKVHSIEITPAMKKSVLKTGQPIAQAQPQAFDWRSAVTGQAA